MTKKQFLDALSDALSSMPENDIGDSLAYYGEMIDDKIESGMSEEAAVNELGTPASAAHDIMLDMPLPKLIKTKYNKKSAWQAVLLILGSPIWLSIAVAIFAVVLAVYAVLWAVVAALWATDIALFASAVYGFVMFGITVGSSFVHALPYLGIGFLTAGMTILMLAACLTLTKAFIRLSARIMRGIKSLLIGKEQK